MLGRKAVICNPFIFNLHGEISSLFKIRYILKVFYDAIGYRMQYNSL